jgi:hypothetical protein
LRSGWRNAQRYAFSELLAEIRRCRSLEQVAEAFGDVGQLNESNIKMLSQALFAAQRTGNTKRSRTRVRFVDDRRGAGEGSQRDRQRDQPPRRRGIVSNSMPPKRRSRRLPICRRSRRAADPSARKSNARCERCSAKRSREDLARHDEQPLAQTHGKRMVCASANARQDSRPKNRNQEESSTSGSLVKLKLFQLPIFWSTAGVLILHWSRQIGKSFVLASWAVYRLLTKPGRLVTVLSNSKDNGIEFMQKVREVCALAGVAFEEEDLSRR